jgi:hypothetical protein
MSSRAWYRCEGSASRIIGARPRAGRAGVLRCPTERFAVDVPSVEAPDLAPARTARNALRLILTPRIADVIVGASLGLFVAVPMDPQHIFGADNEAGAGRVRRPCPSISTFVSLALPLRHPIFTMLPHACPSRPPVMKFGPGRATCRSAMTFQDEFNGLGVASSDSLPDRVYGVGRLSATSFGRVPRDCQ